MVIKLTNDGSLFLDDKKIEKWESVSVKNIEPNGTAEVQLTFKAIGFDADFIVRE